jgi:excisionase family DNA binding protein
VAADLIRNKGAEVHTMAKKQSDVLNIDELAEYLKLAKPTIYKLAQNGKIPGKKAGRQWRFHKDAIDRWLSEQDDSSHSEQSRD